MRIFAFVLLIITAGCQVVQTNTNKAAVPAPNPVLFTVGDTATFAEEFIYVYKKNNAQLDSAFTRADVEEYLELYHVFKLKIREAYAQHMDTSRAYQNELYTYVEQLKKPYLTASRINETLVEEAYARYQEEIRASHILIRVEETAPAADTLAAYEKIRMIRDLAVNGEPFDSLASVYSEDPSAATNGGDLGYFTSMQMVYPFESAAYNTRTGEISPITRTRFGYHILSVNDRRPAQGSVVVSHIMLRHTPDSASVENQIYTIHEQAVGGVSWSELVASYSEDNGSRENDGRLNAFSIGQVPVEFQEASFALESPGQISDPVQTAYGWHIIRLEEKIPVAPLEELRPRIEQRIKQDERASISREAMIEELKDEWGYERAPALDSVLTELTDSASWSEMRGQLLFTLGSRTVTVEELKSYLDQVGNSSEFYTNPEAQFNEFEATTVLAWEEDHLEEKYPDYRMLLREYREGILYFQLMEEEIWKPAGEDSVGVEKFYSDNREDYRFPPKAEAWIYNVPDSATLEKLYRAIEDKAVSEKELILKSAESGEIIPVKASWEEGQESTWEDIPMVEGVYRKAMSDKLYIVEVTRVYDGGYKKLDEIRGLVISDYQKAMEERWVEELKLKYPIERNEEGEKYIYDELVK